MFHFLSFLFFHLFNHIILLLHLIRQRRRRPRFFFLSFWASSNHSLNWYVQKKNVWNTLEYTRIILRYHKIRCCIVQRHSNACQGNIINGIENGKVSSDINNNFPINWNCDIDIWWQSAIQNMSDRCEPVWIDAEDDLFILYTR